MSILHRPMFSKEPPEFPANEAAVRCARMRVARALEIGPWVVVAPAISMVGTVGEVLVVLPLASKAGRAPLKTMLSTIPRPDVGGLVFFVGMMAAMVVFAPRIGRWQFDRLAAAGRLERRKRFNPKKWLTGVRIGGAAVAVVCGIGLLRAGPARPALVVLAAQLVLMSGTYMLVFGLRGRSGARVVCARCDYPMGSWRMSREADQCPECGCAWRETWGQRFGVRRVNRRLVGIGVGLLVLSVVLVVVAGRGR